MLRLVGKARVERPKIISAEDEAVYFVPVVNIFRRPDLQPQEPARPTGVIVLNFLSVNKNAVAELVPSDITDQIYPLGPKRCGREKYQCEKSRKS